VRRLRFRSFRPLRRNEYKRLRHKKITRAKTGANFATVKGIFKNKVLLATQLFTNRVNFWLTELEQLTENSLKSCSVSRSNSLSEFLLAGLRQSTLDSYRKFFLETFSAARNPFGIITTQTSRARYYLACS
jgi:hypothetical protein